MENGRISLITPEGVRLSLSPAGPAARAWAWAIDFLIWLAFTALLAWIFKGTRLGTGIMLVALFVSYWGYPILCEVYFGGRTPGKRIAGLEVLRSDGLPVGWRESCLRNLLLVADFLPMLYFTGLLSMLCDSRFRRLGDIAAGTLVVYVEKPQARPAPPQVEPLPLPFPLAPQQQRMLADLFEREARISPERLNELGTIAEPLTGLTEEASVQRLRAYAAGLAQ